MKVLITGGAGFIGGHIVEHLQQTFEVRVLDNLHSGFLSNLAGCKYEFIQASILDRDAVRKAVSGVDYVFHLAGMISVPESMRQPIKYNEVNTQGTLVVLEEAAAAGVKKLVFSSSAAVYGDNPKSPKVETMREEPKSPYAVSKLDGEYYCNMFTETSRLQTICLRYFNVFGPRQNVRSHYASAVPIFVSRALKGDPISIYGDGEQTRDFVYVKDIAAANVHFCTRSTKTGVFNVACGSSTTVKDLAGAICQITGSNSQIVHCPERTGDIKHSLAGIEKITSAGFKCEYNLRNGLEATIDYYRRTLK